MKTIELANIIIKNFRSYNKAEFEFPRTLGLKLFTGDNRVEPRLGANAAGKTSFWDAWSWLCYGSSIKGARISSLIGWGGEDLEVIGLLRIGPETHMLRRYGPPMKIELNGKLVTQEEVDKLLGLDKARFLHSVVFGQGVALFPDLAITDRGFLLDEVLSLNVWQLAADKAGEKVNALEIELNTIKENLAYIKGKLETIASENAIQTEIDKWEIERDANLANLQNQEKLWEEKKLITAAKLDEQIEEWKGQQAAALKILQGSEETWKDSIVKRAEDKIQTVSDLEAELAPLTHIVEQQGDLLAGHISLLERALVNAQRLHDEEKEKFNTAFYEVRNCAKAETLWREDKCPQCNQVITEDKKRHELECISKVRSASEANRSAAEQALLKIDSDIQSYTDQLSDLRATSIREQEKLRNTKRDVMRIQATITVVEHEAQGFIEQLDKANPYSLQIEQLERQENPYIKQKQDAVNEQNPYTAQIETCAFTVNPFKDKLLRNRLEREWLTNEYNLAENEYKLIDATMAAAQYWKHGFKRIRLYFVQQVLAALEIEIQSAISALGLEGWGVKLATETETKSQTIKLGIQIHITSPVSAGSWDIWSGGEAQRLRLAIAMGLASLIQRAAGVFYTLEVWDEPTKGLSPQGVEDLLEALRYRADVFKKQVWITDHSALTYSGFKEIWCAVKERSGSQVVLLSGE